MTLVNLFLIHMNLTDKQKKPLSDDSGHSPRITSVHQAFSPA
jgi:hypothetical protein